MFHVYLNHKEQTLTRLPPVQNIEAVRKMAERSAENNHDILYRVFEVNGDSEKFVVAISVLQGIIRESNDPTIPNEHW